MLKGGGDGIDLAAAVHGLVAVTLVEAQIPKPRQRAAIGLECHEALKSMAATVDADFTDMNSSNADQPHTEEAA